VVAPIRIVAGGVPASESHAAAGWGAVPRMRDSIACPSVPVRSILWSWTSPTTTSSSFHQGSAPGRSCYRSPRGWMTLTLRSQQSERSWSTSARRCAADRPPVQRAGARGSRPVAMRDRSILGRSLSSCAGGRRPLQIGRRSSTRIILGDARKAANRCACLPRRSERQARWQVQR
jgi:hypothetical protein